MAIQIDDIEPRRSYDVGASPQAAFTIPFPFFDAADIRCSVGGVELESGFTVTGAGSSSGGTLTLGAAVSNTVVTIWRDVAIKRTSQFPASGPLRTEVLNADLNKQIAVLQQLADRMGRSIGLPDAERTVDTKLPGAATRARKSLIFDDDGAITVSSFDHEQQARFPVQAAASAAQASAAKTDAEEARDQAATIRDQTSAVALGDFVQPSVDAVPRSVLNKLREGATVQDFGAKPDGSAIATSAFTAAAAFAHVVHVPQGLYDLTGAPAGAQNVGYFMLGPRFQHAGPPFPDWQCEPSFYTGAKPRAWMALEGSVDRQDGQFGIYVGMRIKPTGGGPNYMKGPILAKVITHDASGPDATTRDAVAITGQGIVASGNVLGRAWALHGVSIVEAGADGLVNGLELDMANFNASAIQKTLNQPTSKSGARIFASNGHTTSGIHFDYDPVALPAASMQHAISINPACLDSDGYAFRLASKMAIMADGKLAVGVDAVRAGYVGHFESPTSARVVLRGAGTNEHESITFLRSGVGAWSVGAANLMTGSTPNTPFRIALSEGVTSGTAFEIDINKSVGIGGSVPTGSGSYDLYFHQGTAPLLAPGAGYCAVWFAADGKLKFMSPGGVTYSFSMTVDP